MYKDILTLYPRANAPKNILLSIYSKEGEEAVFDFISPKNWNLVDITIPPPTGDGLPEKYRTFFIFNF